MPLPAKADPSIPRPLVPRDKPAFKTRAQEQSGRSGPCGCLPLDERDDKLGSGALRGSSADILEGVEKFPGADAGGAEFADDDAGGGIGERGGVG